MKKKKGTRGAVSVFLAIILVPCILISSLFVDVGRVHLSKTMAESSADLALNTLMTNYDADLNEWYGMVASCQNIEEFYTISANYYIRTLQSQGMSEDEIILLSDYYANATGDDTIYDLLQIECSSKSVKAVKNANLSQAPMIKDQVVEFMKYRGPIEIMSNLITRIQNDPTVVEAQQADANEPLAKDKEEFYESEGKLLKAAHQTYKAINKFFTKANDIKLTNDYLKGVYSDLTEYKDVYKKILKFTVANLSNTSGLGRYSRVTVSKTQYNDQYSNPDKQFSEVYSQKKEEDDVITYYIDLSDVQKLVNDLDAKIQAFETAKSNFNEAAQPALNKLPFGTGENQSNPMQWWVMMNKAVNASSGTNHTSKVKNAAQEMMRAYSKVLAVDGCTLRGTVPKGWSSLADWKTEYKGSELIAKAESLQVTYLTAGKSNDNDTYLKAVKKLEEVSSSQNGNRSATSLYVTVDGENKNLNSAVSHISKKLTDKRKELQACVTLLNVAIDGDGVIVPSLDDLKSYATTYEQKLTDWTNSADTTTYNGQKTEMAKQDKAEIEKREETIEIKDEDVDALKKRLVNIRSQLQAAIDAIDSLKWGGKAIKDISSMDTFKSKAGVSSSKIGLTNAEIDSYTNTLFGEKFVPKTIASFAHENDSAYNPTINPKTKEVDTPEFWIYLCEKYEKKTKEADQAEKEEEEATKTSDTKADDAKNKDRYPYNGKNVPHKFSADGKFSAGDSITSLMNFVSDVVKGENALANMRDDLYMTAYIMEMFTHVTKENEGLYNLVEKEKLTELTLNNYKTYYEADTVKGKSDTDKGTWMSADPVDTFNKSLTNKQFTTANNAAYCAEIEYILRGGTNEQAVKDVFTQLYGIRYALNFVSGFDHFWALDYVTAKSKSNTALAVFSTASAIASVTSGIVPIPVTEAVLIPILTIFETSSDLDRLNAGFPVELYKTEPGQWWMSLDSQDKVETKEGNIKGGIGDFMTKLTSLNPLTKKNTDQGLFYSDYLTIFVYLGLSGDATEGMLERMAEVIQFNIGTLAGKKDYSLQKSRVYFQLDATQRVKPLMLNLPFFSQEEYKHNLNEKLDWCTYKIHTVRGYS